jgi:hypothetical protein
LRYKAPQGGTVYEISVANEAVGAHGAVASCLLDGRALALDGDAALVPLLADGGLHKVEIVLRAAGSA